MTYRRRRHRAGTAFWRPISSLFRSLMAWLVWASSKRILAAWADSRSPASPASCSHHVSAIESTIAACQRRDQPCGVGYKKSSSKQVLNKTSHLAYLCDSGADCLNRILQLIIHHKDSPTLSRTLGKHNLLQSLVESVPLSFKRPLFKTDQPKNLNELFEPEVLQKLYYEFPGLCSI